MAARTQSERRVVVADVVVDVPVAVADEITPATATTTFTATTFCGYRGITGSRLY